MSCIVCHHADLETGTTTITFDRPHQTVVVREVPANVCANCGEAYVADEVAAAVELIVAEARAHGGEVEVRHFSGAAA